MVNGVTANNKIYLTAEGEKYEKADSWTNGVYVDFRLTDENVEYMKTFDAVASTFNDPNFKHTLDIRLNANFLLSMNFLDHTPKDEWENYFPSIDLFWEISNNFGFFLVFCVILLKICDFGRGKVSHCVLLCFPVCLPSQTPGASLAGFGLCHQCF